MFVWFHFVAVVVMLCWVGLGTRSTKEFGISMGLHVRSFYEGKGDSVRKLLILGSHK